ncbi:MAG: DUF4191 family protein [Bifidobacteriaceae bacterium]|nr:DUF4191 family protein [Bifidobacteriaceae bacterium]
MVDKSTKKKKSGGTFKQLVQVYRFTARKDKALPWWMALVFVVPIIVLIIVCLLTKANTLIWILLMLTAVLVGLTLATLVLTHTSDRVGYKQLEGQAGAPMAVLGGLGRVGFTFPQEPVWMNRKTRDTIWRGTGRPGIFLVGEGDKQRLSIEMNREEAAMRRLVPGSAIQIYRIFVGEGEGYTPLPKLRNAIVKRRARLTKSELKDLQMRLSTIQTKRAGIPHGVDPRSIKVNSRMMRRHNND